jgi:dihydrofolate synthase/folylpolyglutamate synthase
MQRLDAGPLPSLLRPGAELWLDGGHNPAAGRALAQTMADLEERSPKPLHLIVGMMGLKDAGGFLSAFRGLASHVVTVPIPGAHEAPHAPETLAETAREVGLKAESASDVAAALKRTDAYAPGPKRILICGSLYLPGTCSGCRKASSRRPTERYTRSTKLSTTRFLPASSNSMVSLLPSTSVTVPAPNF